MQDFRVFVEHKEGVDVYSIRLATYQGSSIPVSYSEPVELGLFENIGEMKIELERIQGALLRPVLIVYPDGSLVEGDLYELEL